MPDAAPRQQLPIPEPPRPQGELAALARAIRACTRCPLHASRAKACPGEGPRSAAVMIVGEAPGHEENRQGRPFVGPAGHLLTDILARAGFPRQSLYWANTVRCMPPRDASGSAAPPQEAIDACLPHLHREIEIVRPAVVVLAGATATRALLGTPLPISRARGRAYARGGRWLYPVYHPSFLLRSRGDPRLAADMETDIANLRLLLRAHEATSARPWSLPGILASLYASRAVPHAPTPRSPAASWRVVDRFALPRADGETVTWDISGLHPVFRTPSAVQELLRRWTGLPVALDRIDRSQGAAVAIARINATAPAPRADADGSAPGAETDVARPQQELRPSLQAAG